MTLEGTVDAGQGGNTITNTTTAATGDQVDPSTVGDDLNESVNVDPLVIADLGVAKSIVGDPILTDLGNFVVTYQLVVENTGNVDLGSLSLIEDLDGQFGSAFVGAGNLSLINGPPTITLDSAGFNGNSSTELLLGFNNTLAIGESFIVQYDVEIDPRQVSAPLENQVVGAGTAIDASGNPIQANGSDITATDLSDSGTAPNTPNPDALDDQGTSDDPTLFNPPPVPLGVIGGTVFQDDNGDGFQQPGEIGIPGVEVTLTGTDVFGNNVQTTVFTDAFGAYLFEGLEAGDYTITQTQPEGFTDGIDIGSDGMVTSINDVSSNINLAFGQSIGNVTFAEQLQTSGVAGNPPSLPRLGPIFNSPIRALLNGPISGPGPIYSGIPINANGDPLSLDSGRAVTGGYAVDTAGDLGAIESIDPCCEPTDACGQMLNWAEEIIEQPVDCGCEGDVIQTGDAIQTGPSVLTEEQIVPENNELTDSEQIERVDEPEIPSPLLTEATLGKTSFMKRMSNWLPF